jgi:hypothetical protein
MKLYNLYQDIILEEITKAKLLVEAMSTTDVDTILDGDPNRQGVYFKVNIKYKSENGEVSDRFIEVYQRNISIANNPLIDAYQLSKNNKSSGVKLKLDKENRLVPVVDKNGQQVIEDYEGWRKFRLDRILSFKVSKVAYFKPRPGFNDKGNNSPTVSSTQKIAGATTDYQYKDTTLKQRKQTQQQAQAAKVALKNKSYSDVEKQRKDKLRGDLEQKLSNNLKQQTVQPQQQTVQPQQNIQQPEMDNDLENKDELNK